MDHQPQHHRLVRVDGRFVTFSLGDKGWQGWMQGEAPLGLWDLLKMCIHESTTYVSSHVASR